jgi:hypothetical protein
VLHERQTACLLRNESLARITLATASHLAALMNFAIGAMPRTMCVLIETLMAVRLMCGEINHWNQESHVCEERACKPVR